MVSHMDKEFWCKFNASNLPEIRFDPMQSYRSERGIFGFRINIVSSRADRPRDQKRNSTTRNTELEDPAKSVLMQIATGVDFGIAVSGDEELLMSATEEPVKQDLMRFKGLTVINKYAAVNIDGINNPGVALVSFATEYSEHLDREEPIFHLLHSLQTVMNSLIRSKNSQGIEYRTNIVFLNIGPTSGASLRQLHTQAYALEKLQGSISETFQRAFEQYQTLNDNCLTCKLSNERGVIADHLDQQINVDRLILWEDDYVRLVHPYAPIRPISLRLYIKRHISWIGELNHHELHSIAKSFTKSYQILKNILPPGWSRGMDRSIAFRQSLDIDDDYHLFIDLLSTIPMGAAEIVDYMSVTSFVPDLYADKMREALEN